MKKIINLICILFTLICNSQEEKKTDSVHYFFDTIEKTIENNNYDETIILSQKAIKKDIENDSLKGYANLSIGKAYLKQKKYGDAVKHLNIAINHFTKKGTHKLTNEAYINLGFLYKLKRDYKTAISYYIKAIEVIKKEYSGNNENLINVYLTLAYIEKGRQNFKPALDYIKKGISVSKQYKNEEQEAKFITCKADIFQLKRDFDIAIPLYLKASEISEKLFGTNYRGNIITYHNLAGVYAKLKYIDKAIEYENRAIEINKKLPVESKVSFTSIYTNMAVYYTEYDKPKKALEYHQKAIFYAEKELGKDHPMYSLLYKNFGDTYYDLKDYENAKKYYKASLNSDLEVYYSSGDLSVTDSYTNLALVAKHQGDLNLAIEYLNTALTKFPKNHYLIPSCQLELTNVLIKNSNFALAKKYLDSLSKKLPKNKLSDLNIDELKDRREFIFNKINYFKGLNNKRTNYSDSITALYKRVIALNNFTLKEYTTTASKDFQLKNNYPLYENYIKHIIKKDNKQELESVFEILEKTKARSLIENFNKNKPYIKTNVPDSLLNLERKLNIDIVYYEGEKSLEINDPQPLSDSLIPLYSTKIFNLKRQKNQLQETFKTKYSNYYNLIYNENTAKIKDIQSALKPNQSLIEYFVGEENIHIFLITKESHKTYKIVKDFPLKKQIQDLRKGIYGYWSNPNNTNEKTEAYNFKYRDNAYKLYNTLIQPIADKLTKELIIIPDAELNYIPFDALLTSKDNDKSYLIKDYQISYNYSATHYLETLSKNKKKSSTKLLAVAPSFNLENIKYESSLAKRSSLNPLKHNISEANSITELFNGKLLKGDEATKSNFLKIAKNYNIIHLSTHAKSNDTIGKFSYIAFQNDKEKRQKHKDFLYVNQLYNLNLNADMVVLSACETGLGELKRGEGIVSLAHGFTYAGARSTITSLWSVNDSQTTILMESFYKNIKEGMPKDKALREAKLKYISNENLTAPYFWAGFIPMGDMNPIEENNSLLPMLLVITVIILILFLIRKRFK